MSRYLECARCNILRPVTQLDDERVCWDCRAREERQYLHCAECTMRIELNWSYCPYCGAGPFDD